MNTEKLLNTYLLALRVETLLFESGFEILSFFALSNDMGFDIVNFAESDNLMHCNWNSILNKTKHKNILLELHTKVFVEYFLISVRDNGIVFICV